MNETKADDVILSTHLRSPDGMTMTVMVSLTGDGKYRIHAIDDLGKTWEFGTTKSASITNSQFNLGVRQFKAMGYNVIDLGI